MKKVATALIVTVLLMSLVSCRQNKVTDTEHLKTETTHCAVTVSDAVLKNTEKGLVLEAKWKNGSELAITYGNAFLLEVEQGDTWEKVPMKEGTAFTLEQCMVYPDGFSFDSDDSGMVIVDDKKIQLHITGHYEVETNHEYRAIISFNECNDKAVSYQTVVYFNTSQHDG